MSGQSTDVKAALAAGHSNVFHRSLTTPPHHAVAAQGSTITLSDGRTILDACGGAGVTCIGQARPEIISAMTQQLQTAGWVHTASFTTTAAEELASTLLDKGPDGVLGSQLPEPGHGDANGTNGASQAPIHDLERAYFVCSGSEAMDTSLKLARQYWYAKEGAQTKRVNFISRLQSYHGNNIGAMSVSSNLARKVPYHNFQDPNVHFLTPPLMRHYYKPNNKSDTLTREEQEAEFAQQLADELAAKIEQLGADTVAAVIMETVGGATTGCMVAPRGYLPRIRKVLDASNVNNAPLLVLDEVMCGAGRTGTYWAFEQEGPRGSIRPDIVTMGKGLGAGYAPIAACLASSRVVSGIRDGLHSGGSFAHGLTYQAHPLSCAAALAVSRLVCDERLVARCARMGAVLERRLKEAFAGKPYVSEVRGRGLFWGVELYDMENGRPFDPKEKVGVKVPDETLRRGVAIYPGTGTIDGVRGDHIIFAPAYTVTEQEIDTMARVAKEACEAVVAQVGR